MRGYRKRPGTQGFSVPLVGASLFFIISLFLFASYKNSAYQQAKKEIYSLYTANRFRLDRNLRHRSLRHHSRKIRFRHRRKHRQHRSRPRHSRANKKFSI